MSAKGQKDRITDPKVHAFLQGATIDGRIVEHAGISGEFAVSGNFFVDGGHAIYVQVKADNSISITVYTNGEPAEKVASLTIKKGVLMIV